MDRYEYTDADGVRRAAIRDAGLPVTKACLAHKMSEHLGWMPDGEPAAALEMLRLADNSETEALRLTIEEGQEIIGELSAALAVMQGEDLKPCVEGCPGHLREKARKAVNEALERWQAVQAERDRMKALAVRQREVLASLDLSFDRVQSDSVLASIESVLSDPDGVAAEEWLQDRIVKAQEIGRLAELASHAADRGEGK